MSALKSILVLSLVFPLNAWSVSANTVINRTANTTAYQEQSTTANKETATTTTEDQSAISKDAATGKSSQSAAAAMNMMMAAALTAACLAPCPKCQMALCAMGALAAMQGMHDAGASGQSGTTYKYGTDTKPGDDSQSVPEDGAIGTGGSKFSVPKIVAEGQAKLDAAGMKVTPSGVTNPDGSFTPASAFNSAASMAEAGIDPSAIADAQKIIADTNANGMKVASVAVDGGGSGGASSVVPNEGGDTGNKSIGLGGADKKGLLAGKTVLFDGEPIGVRGDNIFGMIQVAYDKKKNAKNFIEGDSPQPAAVRLPASLPVK